MVEDYHFIPHPLRHHFYRSSSHNQDPHIDEEVIKESRRTRSAHLVSELMWHPRVEFDSQIYSLTVEEDVTRKATFQRSFERFNMHLGNINQILAQIDQESDRAKLYLLLNQSKFPILNQLLQQVIQDIEVCFSDSDIYIGLLEPCGRILRYEACSSGSGMLGRELVLGEGISFEAIQNKEAILIHDISQVDLIKKFDANVTCGPFACFPLPNYADTGFVGILAIDSCRKAERLQPQAMTVTMVNNFLKGMKLREAAQELFKAKVDGKKLLAITGNDLNLKKDYSNIKRSSRRKLLEIISLLNQGTPLHQSQKPYYFVNDAVALSFLKKVAISLGKFLDLHRRTDWLRKIARLTINPVCSSFDVYITLLEAVTRSVELSKKVLVWKIEDERKIALLASSDPPSDRLAPFLHWNQHSMKRVLLHCEGDDLKGSLVSGNIVKIMVKNETNQEKSLGQKCTESSSDMTNAQYSILWSNNRTQQLTWKELYQILPIRPMNPRHFQLKRILDTFREAPLVKKIVLDDTNSWILIIEDTSRPRQIRYVIQVDFHEGYKVHRLTKNFLKRAVAIASQCISCIRGREQRSVSRNKSKGQMLKLFDSISLTATSDAAQSLENVISTIFSEISSQVPGCRAFILELLSSGDELRYTFSNLPSDFIGNNVARGQSFYFTCVESRTPIVVSASSAELRQRLKLPKELDNDENFPFIFLPLEHEDAIIGVLLIHRFVDVPKGRFDDQHPEHGLMDYLVALSKPLASAIRLKRRSYALYTCVQACGSPLQTLRRLFYYFCCLLESTVVGRLKLRIVEVDFVSGKSSILYDLSECAKIYAKTDQATQVEPVSFRWEEILPDTVANYFSLNSLTQGVCLIEEARNKHRNEEQYKIANHLKKYYTFSFETLLAHHDKRDWNTKVIIAALGQILRSKHFFYAPVSSFCFSTSGVFLTCTLHHKYHFPSDQNYVHRVGDYLSDMIDCLFGRINRSRKRVEGLKEFERICEDITTSLLNDVEGTVLSPDQESEREKLVILQEHLISIIQTALIGSNVYIGLLEPRLRMIRYTSASKGSVMKSKRLKKGNGVSFHAIDKQSAVLIEDRAAADTHDQKGTFGGKIRYFSPDKKKEDWPFIVVPVGRIGVLSLDNLQKYEVLAKEKQPELGVVDFLRQLGSMLNNAITSVREKSAKFREKMRKEAVLQVMRICDDLTRSSGFMLKLVIQLIEKTFNGVDAYIGLAQPLCRGILFTCASSNSNMANKIIDTTNSISFHVFLSQKSVIIPEVSNVASSSREEFRLHPLRRFTEEENGNKPQQGPYICVPIPFLGILSVDTFSGASRGLYTQSSPEPGVIECVENIAVCVGKTLSEMARNDAIKRIKSSFIGNILTMRVFFNQIMQIISQNILSAVEIKILRYSCDTIQRKEDEEFFVKSAFVEGMAILDSEKDILKWLRKAHNANEAICFQLEATPEIIGSIIADTRDVEDENAQYFHTVVVVRRIKGASAESDITFLEAILPHLNAIIVQINKRIEGIVARRNGLLTIESIFKQLENSSPVDSILQLHQAQKKSIDLIAEALSSGACDAYLGERQLDGTKILFTAASSRSLMEGRSIDTVKDRDLHTLQTMRTKKISKVHLLDGKNYKLLKQLTEKKAVRAFVAMPLGDDRVLCADSFGIEAFDPLHKRLEDDVLMFLQKSGKLLLSGILSTRYRFSYHELASLQYHRHFTLQNFFSTLLRVAKRDLVTVECEQILELSTDFTGNYAVMCWYRSPNPRVLTKIAHFCYENECDNDLIQERIHFEKNITLPMTNLPRTLDQSRITTKPEYGMEKRGSFSVPCLTSMIDTRVENARFAFCVFGSHDTPFTADQVKYFTALSAVASEVYLHVFQSCLLANSSVELMFFLRERFTAQECTAVTVSKEKSEKREEEKPFEIMFPYNGPRPVDSLKKKTTKRLFQFLETNMEIAIYSAVKTTSVPVNSVETRASTAALNQEVRKYKTSFISKPKFLAFGKSQLRSETQVKKDTGAGINELKSEVLNTQETQACVLYLLVRGFEFELRSSRNHLDLISLKALKSPDDDVTQIEMDIVGSINRAKTEIQQCLMLKRTHDNKEIYSCNFGSSQGRNGGSGFLILSLLNRVKAGFNRETLRLEEEVRKALTFLNSLPDTSKSINSLNSSSFTLICISMIICGYKKEFLKVENQKEILKEFLKGNVTRRIIQLDWTDRKIWAATLRARAHIKSCLGDNPVGKISQIDAMRSRTAESTVNPFSTMLEYILTAVAATRYFKWLDEIDKSKKNFLDLSAIVLQCSYRAFRSIKLLEKLRREFKAARIIQCAFRQLLARRKLYYLKVTKAASTIQQAFRRKIDRRKGKKTKKIVEELYELSNSLGGISPVGILSEKSRSVTWKTDTTYFDSFEAFLKSRLGRDEIKKEEAVAGERFHSLAKQREGLSTEDRLVLEVMDLFEIYDNARTGCITREATRDLMARLRCPLDPAELDDIIDMIDDDKSGDISFKEFISWYSHEYSLMRSRSKDVGLLSKKDRAWFIESAAEISLRKRWEEQKNNAKLAQSSTE